MDIHSKSSAKSDAEVLLQKIKFTKDLMQDLKNCENRIMEDQTKLPSLKETQWRMKHKITNLMSYHELLSQMTKPPEDWVTSEQVTLKTSEILDDYRKEKTRYKDLLAKSKSLSNTLQEAEEISQSGEDIESLVADMKKKAEETKAQEATQSDAFDGVCKTAEEAENLIQDLRMEIEREKEVVALLERRCEIDGEAESAEKRLLKSVEKYFGSKDSKN